MYFLKHTIHLLTIFILFVMLFLSSCEQQSLPEDTTMGAIEQQHISDQHIPDAEPDYDVTITDQDVLLFDKLQTVYDYEQVYDLFNKNIGMDEFVETFGITKIKRIQEMTYTVMNSSDGLLLVIFTPYDEFQQTDNVELPENAIYREVHIKKIQFSDITTQSYIDTIQVGASVFDIEKVDPDGSYDFLSASWSGYPQFSYHFYEDGNAAIIQYEDNLVIKITRFTL